MLFEIQEKTATVSGPDVKMFYYEAPFLTYNLLILHLVFRLHDEKTLSKYLVIWTKTENSAIKKVRNMELDAGKITVDFERKNTSLICLKYFWCKAKVNTYCHLPQFSIEVAAKEIYIISGENVSNIYILSNTLKYDLMDIADKYYWYKIVDCFHTKLLYYTAWSF